MNNGHDMQDNHPVRASHPTQYIELDEGYHAEPAPPAQVSPFKRLHLLLRGRYHWAVLLGLIGALGGAYLGFNFKKPEYQSTGMLRVRPVVPTILYANEDSGVMPMFKAFVESQVQLMTSPRVLTMAMESDGWRKLGRGMTPEVQAEFRQNLEVTDVSDEIIAITFEDTNKEAANAAVKGIIDAYMQIYGERDVAEEAQRLGILEQRRTALSNQLESMRSRIRAIADEFGSDALEQMYEFNLSELQKLESALRTAQIQLAATGTGQQTDDEQPQDPEVQEPVGPDPQTMSLQEIAEYDPRMDELLQRRGAIEATIEELTFRYGKEHRQVKVVASQLVGVDKLLEDRAAWFRENHTAEDLATTPRLAREDPRLMAEADPAFLRQRVDQLSQLHATARDETLTLGRQKLEIDSLKVESRRIKERLEETRFRIEQLNVESAVSGRLEVISEGDLRPEPVNASKRKQFTILGAGGMGMLGVGLVLLMGLMDRRLKDSNDAGSSTGNLRLLGMLPELPHDLSDPEQAQIAGHCVHHIRTLLQIQGDASPRIIVVTSGAGGSGKTSLTLALGLSYASSGSRTLLVDADLIGSGLTRNLEAIKRRRIGQILRQHGLVNDEQLEHALKLARRSGRRLGGCLVEMGVLSEGEIKHALSLQEASPVGLLDTLDGEPLEECVAETGISGLEILPVGGAGAHDTSRLSPATVKRLLHGATRAYDIILIDTGPVPGSIESSIVAAAADAVVPVFARGESRTTATNCVSFLRSIGARVTGVVFNRATTRDLNRSTLSSSLSKPGGAATESHGNGREESATSKRFAHFGPVAHAVVRSSEQR